ncbi:hypothetical protein ABVT39_025425 [Epinephelus coioides]
MLSLKVAELEEKLAWHEMGARPKTATFSVENEDIVKKDDQCRAKAAEKPKEAGSIIDREPNPKAVPCSKKGASPKTVRFNLEHEYIIIEDYDSGQHEKPPKEQKCWKDFAEYADESIIEAQERKASGKGGMLSLNVANQIGFCPWTVIFNAAKEFSVINDDDDLGQHEKPDVENPGQEEELGWYVEIEDIIRERDDSGQQEKPPKRSVKAGKNLFIILSPGTGVKSRGLHIWPWYPWAPGPNLDG